MVALCVCALPVALIIVAHFVDEERDAFHPVLWATVFAPCVVLFAVEIAIANLMAPKVGFDMVQERSPNVSMREAMRSNLTNLALVSALFLTIVYAMFQVDTASDAMFSMLTQWYIGLLAISCMQMSIAIMGSVICLLYTEPLSEKASILTISNNLMQFGEPATQSMMGIFNTMVALDLWIYERFGLVASLLMTLTIFYGVMRVIVNYIYLSSFKNPDVDAATRKDRDAWKQAAATTGNAVTTGAVWAGSI